ncbi:unnamed protein product [Effrenium voratum]|nr:unnamed protein product [Effrenium voratum]
MTMYYQNYYHHDSSGRVVQRWLGAVIIGMGICPWAKPAGEAGGIRVVSSTAAKPREALVDLRAEARRLRGAASPVTTLLVCPAVEAWEDFEDFNDFRENELRNGEALAEEFQCKVVCFHPCSQASNSYGLQAGDEILIQTKEGDLAGTILEISETSPRELTVQIFGQVDRGAAEMAIEPVAERICHVSEGDALQLLGREALQDEDECRSILGRAPRVVLHLLRTEDLEVVDDKKALETLERNEQVVEKLGLAGFDELVKECG